MCVHQRHLETLPFGTVVKKIVLILHNEIFSSNLCLSPIYKLRAGLLWLKVGARWPEEGEAPLEVSLSSRLALTVRGTGGAMIPKALALGSKE